MAVKIFILFYINIYNFIIIFFKDKFENSKLIIYFINFEPVTQSTKVYSHIIILFNLNKLIDLKDATKTIIDQSQQKVM